MLFTELDNQRSLSPEEKANISAHLHAEARDEKTIKQIDLRLRVSEDKIKDEVNMVRQKYYSYIYEQKYLKYKAKYLALKQKLESQ
jgi:hypothetical protein